MCNKDLGSIPTTTKRKVFVDVIKEIILVSYPVKTIPSERGRDVAHSRCHVTREADPQVATTNEGILTATATSSLRDRFSTTASEVKGWTGPKDSDFRFLTSRTENNFVLLSHHKFMIICFGSHKKLI